MESISGGLMSTGIAVTGSLLSKGPLSLAGTVIGDVTCEGKLIVTGRVIGKITAPEAEISGVVEGDISVSGALCILACAKVTGDIEAESLTAWETAAVNGRLSVGRARIKAGEERFAAFDARLREHFPPPEVLGAAPEGGKSPEDMADEDRRQRLKNASAKLKAQKGKKQKTGADNPTKEKEYKR